MDPTVTLTYALHAAKKDRFDEAVDHVNDYYQWRVKGGFEPRGHFRVYPLANPVTGGDQHADQIVNYLIGKMQETRS